MAGAYPGFCSIKQLRVLRLPPKWDASPSQGYRIYSCISRPFKTKKSAQKFALDLYTRHTQRPDQAIQEISITIA